LLWTVSGFQSDVTPWVEFQLMSPHGDQGYPGNLKVITRYSLLQDNTIKIEMMAKSDRPTIVNMTNHAYFNLNGRVSADIYKHKAQFFASKYLKTDNYSIPSGEQISVKNTPLDFTQPKEIGLEINEKVEPISLTSGYDQYFVFDSYEKGELNLMAEVIEPLSGRKLQVASTLPGFQFYTGNAFDSILPLSFGKVHGNHSAFCIEPSYFPDAPNHPEFDSIRSDPEKLYNEIITYKFSTL